MLSDEQIEAIALSLYEFENSKPLDAERDPHVLPVYIEKIYFVAKRAIALQAEQDRRSLTAVGKYLGVTFTAQTDVVSEVYNKLDEIMTVFREHSQEIAIAQQIKTLNNQLEKYLVKQTASNIPAGPMGSEEGRPLCSGEVGISDNQDQCSSQSGV